MGFFARPEYAKYYGYFDRTVNREELMDFIYDLSLFIHVQYGFKVYAAGVVINVQPMPETKENEED